MKTLLVLLSLLAMLLAAPATAAGKSVATPYAPAKVVLIFISTIRKKSAARCTGSGR